MDRRTSPTIPANPIAAAIVRAGESSTSVSKATGIPLATLSNPSEMTVDDLGKVGGFLHIHPAKLLGIAA